MSEPKHDPCIDDKSSQVKFNTALKVVLIPSRTEYKLAGLCPHLWWTSSDYFMFQQSAHSEIRLLSAFENINLNAARKKLYQPCENEAIDDTDFCSSNSSSRSNSSNSNNGDSVLQSINDSVKLNRNNNNNDVHNLNNDNSTKVLSSPRPQANSNNIKRIDSLTHLNETKVYNHEIYEDNNDIKTTEWSNNDLLSFCVPLKETLSLRFECKSRQSSLSKVSINFSMLITYGSLLILIAFLVLDTSGYLS